MNKLSIIYTNCNRIEDNICTKLWMNSLLQQTNKNFNIIIVDSESDNIDYVKSVVDKFRENGINTNLLYVKKLDIFNKSLFLNTGAKFDKDTYNTEYFCFSDVDMIYSNDFIDTYYEHIEKTQYPNKLFGPSMRSIHYGKFNTEDIDICSDNIFKDVESNNRSIKVWRNLSGGCQCCSSELFFSVGGYNKQLPDYQEDTIFRKMCRGKSGREIKWRGDRSYIYHLPHDKNEYCTKSRVESRFIYWDGKYTCTYDGFETVNILNRY